ncbi:EamA family transporter [Crassaminicella thermophila]|uniref:EamA family transporter n=1 Tax=Crassaminicella thermophila TaxID=2599308 RepID=A0A5C0SII7_CRATE|nr:DMT family transporter [Crassaminicella thermophila]QEK13516.1 EamA family transporter [Crassaminicella thermophila]
MLKCNINHTQKGYIAGILSAIFFGFSGLFVKLAQGSGLDSASILILQYIITIPTMWIIAFLKYKNQIKINKNDLIKLFFIGMFLQSSVSIFYYESFKYLDISIATILLFTYPIWITIFSSFFSKIKLNKVIILSVIITFLGCILVLDILHINTSFSLKGTLLGLGGAFFLAFSNIFLEKFENRIPPFILSTYSSTFIFLNLIIFRFPKQLLHINITKFQLINVALLVFICQIPPGILMYTAIQYIGAVKTAIIGNIEIPTAALIGYIFYKETLNPLQFIGILLVLGGIMLMQNSEYIQNKLFIYFHKINEQKSYCK